MAAAVDSFASYGGSVGDCYALAAAVVTSDTVDLGFVSRAIWVGGAGNVVATIGGVDVTFTAVAAGTLLRIRASRIKATLTTATLMVALW